MVKILEKLNHIIRGWYYKIFGKNKELYNSRIIVCNECEHKECFGKYCCICELCGCELSAKLRVKEEKCIIGKW